MKSLVLVALFGVGAVAIWKHHLAAANKTRSITTANDLPAGVSVYPSDPAPQQPQQIVAAAVTNSDAVSDVGFGAAFGPYENQPGDGEVAY